MIRPILTELALFLTPFALFALFLWFSKSPVVARSSWPPNALAALTIAALVLMLGSFFLLAHFSGAPPGATYVPAHIDEQGRFVPGEVK
jgi:hypothetical protein